jgi:hypothetical protein
VPEQDQSNAATARDTSARDFLDAGILFNCSAEGAFEPRVAGPLPAFRQGEMGRAADARVKPGGGVAEAFADIIAGACRAFFHRGRFAQLSARPGRRFGFEQLGPGAAGGVSETRPCKMKDLVHGDQPQVARFSSEFGFENDLAAADEGSGVHRNAAMRRAGEQLAAMRGEARKNFNRYRIANERGQTGGGGANVAAGRCANVSADLEPEERKRPEPVFGETGFWGPIRWRCQKTPGLAPEFYTSRVLASAQPGLFPAACAG